MTADSFSRLSLIRIAALFLVAWNLGCSVQKPSAPSWDVDVTIPLVGKSFTMQKIADDEEAITVDSSGTLAFEETSDLDQYLVGDQLDVADMNDSFTLTLGSFDIRSPGSEMTSVTLREIFSSADALNGQTAVVPPFNFTTDKKALNAYGNFSYVIIENGSITVTVANGMAIPLGAPVTLEVWDSISDTLVVSVTSNTQIQPGATQTFSSSLANKRLPNTLSIRMVASSPGSGSNPVVIDANSQFAMTGTISDLKVREAMASVPEQRVSRTDAVTITDSLVVNEATVERGTLSLQIGGDLPLDAWLVYELPDFYRPGGEAFVDSFFITRNQNITNNINLAGFSLRPGAADFSQQQVRFSWHIRTIDTGNNFALVRASDVMGAGFDLSNVRFSRVTGRIGQQDIDISQPDISFNIPADLDSIFFETAELELVINNGINFPARLKFSIEGQNDNGSVSYLNVDEVIQPAAGPGQPKTTTIRLNQNNSNIKDFISILPNLVKIDGRVALGDPNWVGTVSKSDFVDGLVKITAPLALRLPEQQIESDVNELNIEEGVRNDIIDNLGNGLFFAEIENHLPIGATVDVVFGENDSTLFSQPDLVIGLLRAGRGNLDSNGYVDQSQISKIDFSLTEDQMRTFLKQPLYSGIRVSIDGTNGQFVKVRPSDFIQVKSYSKLRVKINQN